VGAGAGRAHPAGIGGVLRPHGAAARRRRLARRPRPLDLCRPGGAGPALRLADPQRRHRRPPRLPRDLPVEPRRRADRRRRTRARLMRDPDAFILENTALKPPSLVPEIRLHLADAALSLWEKTETEL